MVNCPTCACGCRNRTEPGSCVDPDHPILASVVSPPGKAINAPPLVQCTSHMCPIRVHWHVKVNYKEYWRVKVTIKNFNYRMNYTQWNLVVQHPNFDNLTQIFSFNYKPLTPYEGLNDTGMMCKVSSCFERTSHLSHSYPWLPNASSKLFSSLLSPILAFIASLVILLTRA
ncbi:hypothetical protein K1719_011474 [Acacia pycnantha]|nr:hypothetical protein K1719_011474 [Acacia pycnantha]